MGLSVNYYWLQKIRQEAYASKETELPVIQSIQEQQPAVTFAKIPLPDQQTSITDTFKADAVIHTGNMVIGISNTISRYAVIPSSGGGSSCLLKLVV